MDYPLFSVYCTLKSNTVLLKLYMKTRINQLRPLALLLLIIPLASSCINSKKVIYFSNLNDTALGKFYTQDSIQQFVAHIESGDILDIHVTSLNSSADAPFNQSSLPASPGEGTGASMGAAGSTGGIRGYLVDESGYIDFPFIGKLHVQGYTTAILRDTLEAKLGVQYLKMPSVNVHFTNFKITVLGEVTHPASYNITSERVSIIDAIGMAGDLAISGKRENILVVRETGGRREFARLDLNSSDIFKSPYYFLKQNDIVYVEPRKSKIQASDDRFIRNFSIVTGTVGLILTIILLFK
jgi:polysaccharide export outer membrane protein